MLHFSLEAEGKDRERESVRKKTVVEKKMRIE